ncbi:hypothetical protein [Streptomyces rimosus]|uniref:hypothetical protein n=1 Tax=Streptomyces rimosus TaxID=1927 RepID=UPI00067BBB66|nr:hypothetical protein [Streptomyces rimosus]
MTRGAPPSAPRSGPPRRDRPRRPRRRLSAAAPAAGLALLLCGCGAQGKALVAGPAATASAPVRLWPDLPAPERPTGRPDPPAPDRVPHMPAVPDGDIRALSALAVVQAEVAAHPGVVTGGDGMYADTARRITACARIGAPGCPLREPRFHDLTGNGKDEMIVGFEDRPDGGSAADASLGLRAYTLDHGVAVRILSTHVRPLSVEVAGREVIVREPAELPGYENRSVYAWDADLRGMTLHREEIRRVRPATPPAG